MKWLWIIAVVLLGGCGPYAGAQIELLAQARKGLATAAEHQASQRQVMSQLATLRRQRLDEAFDGDVVDRANGEGLVPQWVIDHRKAYAAALDAYGAERAASDQAARQAQRNLEAIDAALAQLQSLQSIALGLGEWGKQP
jgi:hypothetical protein